MIEKIRIGTRKSLLARAQTRIVAEKIKEIAPEVEIELLPIITEGDLRLDKSLGSFGGKGVFTKELEQALLDGRIQMAVHSAKDMPVDFPEGLVLGAVVERAEWEDMIVTRDGRALREMSPGTVIGTGSLRRGIQLQRLNPGIWTREIRGNVQTRLRKLAEGQYDAIVLARAGIERLRRDLQKYMEDGIDSEAFYRQFHYEVLDAKDFLPAAGQAILAVEVSKRALEDDKFAEICRKLNQKEVEYQLLAERNFLRHIGGGCNAPVCAFSWLEDEKLCMKGGFAGDGTHMLFEKIQGAAGDAKHLGQVLAENLRAAGERRSEDVGIRPHDQGKVFLVGAGPGDSGLITVKGLWCIRHADVIVYDYLASDTLLNEAGKDVELIYAGKRSGHHHMSQEEIQEILLEKAFEGKIVVRLKGGDPFIFGRGGEEALALEAAEIPFEIVPGVSSAYSVPAYAGIPVTHRGVASQVHFITGHEEKKGGIDYGKLAKYDGTLVFLMGIKRLPEICGALIQNGMDKNTPAAVICSGTTGSQQEVTATLGTIDDVCSAAGIKPPGILVVGNVVKLSERIGWRQKLPLTGKRVLLTGTRELVRKQHQSLLAQGAEAIDLSLIYTEPAADRTLESVVRNVDAYSWLVFTSSNGVNLFFESMKRFRVDFRRLAHVKIAVVGPGTGEMLKNYGFSADYMPESYTSESLAEGLAGQMKPSQRALVFRAKEGSKALNRHFDMKGIDYDDVAAYTTCTDWRKRDLLLRAMEDTDYVTFASGSAVRAFMELTAGENDASATGTDKNAGQKLVCIGPVTAKAAKDAGLTVTAVAEDYTIEGLTKVLCRL